MCMGAFPEKCELAIFAKNTYYVHDMRAVVQRGTEMRVVPSHGREGGEMRCVPEGEGQAPAGSSGSGRDGPGAEPKVVCTPGPRIRDHH